MQPVLNSTADSAAALVSRWKQGDQRAADELFDRYAGKLTALARRVVSAKLAGRFDPEDVVQSVYRSFFLGARAGRYDARRGGELWRLLVTITMHKVQHQARWNLVKKRSVVREAAGDHEALPSREPSPEDAVDLVDLVDQLLRSLDPVRRRVVELRLQGHDLQAIATETGCSHRTVSRALSEVKNRLGGDRVL